MRHLFLILTAFIVVSCSTLKGKKSTAIASYCDPPEYYYKDSSYSILPLETIAKDSVLLKNYSIRDLYLANAIGVYPLLQKLDSLNKGNASVAERIIVRQSINFRIVYFSSQISSIASELDCEGERADQLYSFLSEKEQSKTKLLTIASITVAGVADVYTNTAEKGEKVVGVAGGVISAALGLMAFFSIKKIDYHQERNLLTDIWNQSESSDIYPDAVWYVLNTKYFSNQQKNSMSYNLRARWIEYGYIDEETEKVYFSKDARYSAGQLKVRANMVNQLQASVRTINQDLEALIRNIWVQF